MFSSPFRTLPLPRPATLPFSALTALAALAACALLALPHAPAHAQVSPAAAAASAPGITPEVAAEIARVKAAMADPNPKPLVVVRPADPDLYRDMGGKMGIDAVVDEMLRRALSDPTLIPFFGDSDLSRLRPMLAQQFCYLAGGPCVYGGDNMRKAHAGLDIRKSDFNRLVETLQLSMDARGIPFTTQNRFLAKLAPFHRDVVNTP